MAGTEDSLNAMMRRQYNASKVFTGGVGDRCEHDYAPMGATTRQWLDRNSGTTGGTVNQTTVERFYCRKCADYKEVPVQ